MRQELIGIAGVLEAEVSFEHGTASVRYLADRVDAAAIESAIDATGFEASRLDAEVIDERR